MIIIKIIIVIIILYYHLQVIHHIKMHQMLHRKVKIQTQNTVVCKERKINKQIKKSEISTIPFIQLN